MAGSSREPANGDARGLGEPAPARFDLDPSQDAFLAGDALVVAKDTETVRHHDQQGVVVGEEQLPAQEGRVLLRPEPERLDQPQIVLGANHRDLDPVAAAVCLRDLVRQLPPHRPGHDVAVGQEDVLRVEHVAGGICVGPRRRRGRECRQREHGQEQASRPHRASVLGRGPVARIGSRFVLLRQVVDDDLGCACYLVADEQTGDAVIVDPPYAIEPLLEQAEREGLRLTCVLETHTHADHLSGHGRLALEHDLPVHVHPAAEPAYPFEPLADGQQLAVGDETVRIVHTPGHRPEHCCFVFGNAVLTGDSLFVGTVARPDLAVDAREGAEGLFFSLRRLLELPDAFRVYPGHVAGSLCGTGMSGDLSSTIGAERRANPALALSLVEDFVDSSASVSLPRPPTTARVVDLNRGPFVGAPGPLEAVAEPAGATVLDVRPPRAFAAGHVRGAINVPVAGSAFGTKAGFVLDPDERIVIHAASPDEAGIAASRLRAVGLLQLRGYLASAETPDVLEPVAFEELEELLAGGAEVLDVREYDERSEGYIPGTRHLPYRLLRACSDSLPRDRPLVTLCESGARAAIAASVLASRGFNARPVLDGGIADWQAGGRSLVQFRRCGQP